LVATAFSCSERFLLKLRPHSSREIPAVQILRHIWLQNYRYEEGQVRWREAGDIPPATLFINSPYDPEAHLGKKRSTMWTGYKIHLSETCEEDLPHLITHVATVPAPKTDEAVTESIHAGLQQADLLPSRHLMDSGYVSSQTLVTSQRRFGVEVIGPVLADLQWQAHTEGGLDVSQFHIDWDHQQVTCPQGSVSRSWAPFFDTHHHELIKVQFSIKDCSSCPSRSCCIRSGEKYPRRTLTLANAEPGGLGSNLRHGKCCRGGLHDLVCLASMRRSRHASRPYVKEIADVSANRISAA
jgi:transposase